MILKSRNTTLTILFSLVTIIGSGWLFNQFFSPDQLHQLVEASGYWGYALFVLAYILATLLFLPSTAFNLAGGILFGNFWGLIITSGAAVLSATIAFYISRKLSHDRLAKFFPQAFAKEHSKNIEEGSGESPIGFLDRNLRSNGIAYIAALRILPLIPFSIVSFTAGVSTIRFRDYFLGTLIGAPIGFAPFIIFGNSGIELVSDFNLRAIATPVILIVALLGGRYWYKSRLGTSNN
jgi:uncharacterized membrane protein YdjX (TVP38/TMEM64 family)